jgi:SAM-dependent methyltransferase
LFAGCAKMRCNDCGMVFVSPMPEADALAAYNSAYFVNAHGGIPVDAATIAFHSAINRLRVAHVERFLSAQSIAVQSVLEIGAGGGHFAGHWLARHPETRYHAIEADRSCHPSLLQLGVRLHQTPSECYADAGVDLVVMSHVLEHMADPLGFLQAAAAGLQAGGALFIEVPCRDWEFKDEDEPHLLFFDKEPMQQLLRRLGYRDGTLSYHGRELSMLREGGSQPGLLERIRARLIRFGVVAPFAWAIPGLEALRDPLERAVVAPFQAHCERTTPAWWLRAIARKG